jgi:hypothetical protein
MLYILVLLFVVTKTYFYERLTLHAGSVSSTNKRGELVIVTVGEKRAKLFLFDLPFTDACRINVLVEIKNIMNNFFSHKKRS